MRSIKSIIVDGDDLSRGGLQALMSEADGIDLLGAYADLSTAEAILKQDVAEVLLLSDSLPRLMDMGRIVHRLNQEYPDLSVVIISDKLNCTYTRRIFEKGAQAFVHRDDRLHEKLIDIVRATCRGEVYISPNVSALLVRDDTGIPGVTQRDADILQFLMDGYINGEIALELGLSIQTVYRCLSHLRDLFQARTNEQLIATIRQSDFEDFNTDKSSRSAEKD